MSSWFRSRDPRQGIPAVGLRRLFPNAQFVGGPDLVASGCSVEGHKLEPGEVFVVLPGTADEDVRHAIERGASGLIVERPRAEFDAVQVVVPDARRTHAQLVRALAGDPAASLRVVAVAGARARPAAAAFLRAILEAEGERVGHIAPGGAWSDGSRTYPGSGSPTPEALAGIAETLAARSCSTLIVEIATTRADSAASEVLGPLDALIVTDLPADADADADDRQARRRALRGLARQVRPGGLVVVDADCPEAERIGSINPDADRVGFGASDMADIRAEIRHVGDARLGTELIADPLGLVRLAVLGDASARGALASAAFALSRGIAADRVREALQTLERIPGRLEAIAIGAEFRVLREDAEDAPIVAEGIAELRRIGVGRVLCVPPTADLDPARAIRRLCEARADQVIDAPAASPDPRRAVVERREVIDRALTGAAAGDVVLLLGGAEPTFARESGVARFLDDRTLVADWLRRRDASARRSA